MPRLPSPLLPALCLGATVASACGSDDRGTGAFDSVGPASASATAGPDTTGPGSGDDSTASSASASDSDSGGADTGGNDSGNPPKLDVSAGDGSAGLPGCEKVDFLFVVDNSGSMEDEQNNLVASFPGFMDTIQNTLKAQDYQIMAVDTDGLFGEGGVQKWPCSPDPTCCESGCTMWPNGTCNDHPCFVWSDCDKEIGGGRVTTPLGEDCGIEGGHRYIMDGQTDLAGTFECMARVGIHGDGQEVQMQAMLEAVTTHAGPGQCNEGFVREDAVLVVVLITDEEDDPTDMGIDYDPGSPGDPASWRQTLIDVKGGDPNAVVVLGLVGDPDVAGGLCQPLMGTSPVGAEASPRLRQFVESFGDRGIWGSVCSPDYAPFFQQAVDLIDTACDDFVPPG